MNLKNTSRAEVSPEHTSPKGTSLVPNLTYLSPNFTNGKAHFLTFKSNAKPTHQKIQFIQRRCKQIAKTYLIIRERNKKSGGYHFHAIIQAETKPAGSWFIKGAHMNYLQIGKKTVPERPLDLERKAPTLPSPELTTLEKQEMHHHEQITDSEIEEIAINRAMIACVKRDKTNTEIIKVLRYMAKELELPAQYTDYILSIKGKQTILQYPNTPPHIKGRVHRMVHKCHPVL